MRVHLVPLLIALGAAAAPADPPPVPAQETANVAAFARLFGAARYFYPSDAAAALDWNRLAVLGVARARTAPDAAGLRKTLVQLFAPLGPGIEIAEHLPATRATTRTDEPLVAWRYLGPDLAGNATAGPYRGKRTDRISPASAAIDGFAAIVQEIPAGKLQGKSIRMRGQVRATSSDGMGAAALWLRVDRPAQTMGFFDNMKDRPIREPRWRTYQIEGTVAADAVDVAFGVMSYGAVTADFDGIELEVKDPAGEWTPVPIPDAGFEAAPDGSQHGWFRTGTSRSVVVTRPREGPAEGQQFLRLAPPPPDAAEAELFPDAPPASGAHVDVDLGSGLMARVPTTLTDPEARPEPGRRSDFEALTAALASIPGPVEAPGVDQRLADVVVAWNVFRHFYPYWTETGVAWDARLAPLLEAARDARFRAEQRAALRMLVADARDGHGFVADTLDKTPRGWLPVNLGVVGGRLVVLASSSPDVPAGAVVSTIDGDPAARRLAETMRLQSGTEQWRAVQAASELAQGPKGARIALAFEGGTGPGTVTLGFDGTQPPAERRPEPVTRLAPGIWYVDLTRAAMAKVTPALEEIAGAGGVVFDLRGYPGDAGVAILSHLMTAPEADRWMHIAQIVGPFGQSVGWKSLGWNLAPSSPRITGRVVFLTDGRAISYAESVMGYVADRKLGTIVGAATAGTNGNVASFVTPGGFTVGFTGMRVTGHDGSTPHHLVGIRPDVPVTPTAEGLRAGRDEVLERGIEVLRAEKPAEANGR